MELKKSLTGISDSEVTRSIEGEILAAYPELDLAPLKHIMADLMRVNISLQ